MSDPMTPITRFWQWFTDNEDLLRTAPALDTPDLIEAELRKIDPRLGVELSEPAEQREMIVTAWSQPGAFPVARELVAAAPKEQLANWRILALKPPRGFKFALMLEGLHVDAGVMTFDGLHSPQAPGKLGLRVYVTGAPPADERWRRALPLVIETGLGEEAASEIIHIEPAAAEGADPGKALPLHELPAYLKWHREQGGR